jgi:hypothetical protein
MGYVARMRDVGNVYTALLRNFSARGRVIGVPYIQNL